MNNETQELNTQVRAEDRPAVFIQTIILVAFVALVLMVIIIWLRTPPTPLLSAEEIQTFTRAGKPVLIEFYSNT